MSNKEQMGGIVLAFSNAYRNPEGAWKSTVKDSTNYVSSDDMYDAFKPRIYNFDNSVYLEAKKNLPVNNSVELDFIDNEQDMEQTKFGMTMIQRADEIFKPAPEEKVEEKVETPVIDNVSDNSFIISKDELSTFNPEVRPESSLAEALTPVVEETQDEEMEGEIVSFEAEQEKAKVKTLGKRAAYVDTVILCLIAQLSIFGLLIIVLLIIK